MSFCGSDGCVICPITGKSIRVFPVKPPNKPNSDFNQITEMFNIPTNTGNEVQTVQVFQPYQPEQFIPTEDLVLTANVLNFFNPPLVDTFLYYDATGGIVTGTWSDPEELADYHEQVTLYADYKNVGPTCGGITVTSVDPPVKASAGNYVKVGTQEVIVVSDGNIWNYYAGGLSGTYYTLFGTSGAQGIKNGPVGKFQNNSTFIILDPDSGLVTYITPSTGVGVGTGGGTTSGVKDPVKPPTRANSTLGDYRGHGVYDVGEEIVNQDLNCVKIEDVPCFSDLEECVANYILLSLGDPIVTVELHPAQLKLCAQKAISRMEYYAPAFNTNYLTFTTIPGVNGYELPQFVIDGLEYVAYKKTLLSIASQEGTLERDILIKYYQENFLFRNFDIGEYYLFMSHMEDVRKVLGREGSWQVINNNQLFLYPEPTEYEEVIVEYRALNAETLHHFVKNWINEYATAHAKEMLGLIRGKYPSGLPGPDGPTQLDGAVLRSESKEEKIALEQKLKDELHGQPFITLF